MLRHRLLRIASRGAAPLCAALATLSCGTDDGGTSASAPSANHAVQGLKTDAGARIHLDADVPDEDTTLPNAAAPLVTPTYDGSGQTVEPTVLFFPDGWRGHHYWMAVSPYPHSNAAYENPSILVSEDGLAWSVPEGLVNPLATPDHGALADATIVYDGASDELWMYYLEELREGDAGVHWQILRRMTSQDGIHWSKWTQLLEGTPYPLESPSIVKKGAEFLMWTVDIAPKGCTAQSSRVLERSSPDGVHWTEPAVSGIEIPGYVVWHVNMTQVASTGQLLAVVTAFANGLSCHHTELFLARMESDRWVTSTKPLLVPEEPPAWDDRCIYRSSLLYDEAQQRLRVWYSAQEVRTNAWHLGYTEGKLLLAP